jgi:TRAP-type C4-dicarboxylate transport system permease small subunit
MNQLALLFYRLLMALSCLSMLVAFGTVLLGVVAREANWDIAGLDAYAGYAIAAALFLALPETLRHGDHIRVTLLLERVPDSLRRALEWWCLAVATLLALYIAWYASHLVWISYSTHDVSPGSDASPLWMPQLAMALGCVGFALSFMHALIENASGRRFMVTHHDISHVE